MEITCTNCNTTISQVNYSCNATNRDYGYIILNNTSEYSIGEENVNNSETIDTEDYTYECPECDQELNYSWINNQIRENDTHKKIEHKIEIKGNKNRSGVTNNNIFICPTCDNSAVIGYTDKFNFCTKCKKESEIKNN